MIWLSFRILPSKAHSHKSVAYVIDGGAGPLCVAAIEKYDYVFKA